jgi:hypothetical protein
VKDAYVYQSLHILQFPIYLCNIASASWFDAFLTITNHVLSKSQASKERYPISYVYLPTSKFEEREMTGKR